MYVLFNNHTRAVSGGKYIRAADGNCHTYCICGSGTPLSHCRICNKCGNFHPLLILVATIEEGSGQFSSVLANPVQKRRTDQSSHCQHVPITAILYCSGSDRDFIDALA